MKFNPDTLNKIKDAVGPVIDSLGGELVDIEHAKKYGEDNLTLFVYFDAGTSLDDCERVHYLVSPILDGINPTSDESYVLNISSPGLDRPFKSQRDFERNYGKTVEVRLFAPLRGKKIYSGTLINHDDNITEIEVENKQKKSSYNNKNVRKYKDKESEGDQLTKIEEGSLVKSSVLKLENNKIAVVRPFVDLSRIS